MTRDRMTGGEFHEFRPVCAAVRLHPGTSALKRTALGGIRGGRQLPSEKMALAMTLDPRIGHRDRSEESLGVGMAR